MDLGLFKEILVGKVGQVLMQRRLRNDKEIVLFFLDTGGIYKNFWTLPNEQPEESEERFYSISYCGLHDFMMSFTCLKGVSPKVRKVFVLIFLSSTYL